MQPASGVVAVSKGCKCARVVCGAGSATAVPCCGGKPS